MYKRGGEIDLETAFNTSFVYELATLLAVLDPTAAMPVYLASTAGLPRRQALLVAVYGVGTGFLVLLFFICVGQPLLAALRIPMASFQLAGSLVLLLFGLKLVMGLVSAEIANLPATATMAQRAVYPLAMPVIAGPGAMLAVVMLTDNNTRTFDEQVLTTSRLVIALVIVFCGLLLSRQVYRLIGQTGLEIISRVTGLVLSSIAVTGMITAIRVSFRLP